MTHAFPPRGIKSKQVPLGPCVTEPPYLPRLKSTAETPTRSRSHTCPRQRHRSRRAGRGHPRAAGLRAQSEFQFAGHRRPRDHLPDVREPAHRTLAGRGGREGCPRGAGRRPPPPGPARAASPRAQERVARAPRGVSRVPPYLAPPTGRPSAAWSSPRAEDWPGRGVRARGTRRSGGKRAWEEGAQGPSERPSRPTPQRGRRGRRRCGRRTTAGLAGRRQLHTLKGQPRPGGQRSGPQRLRPGF